jgi:hypothetical protein
MGFQLPRLNAVKAVGIDRNGRRTVGHCAIGKTFNAAHRTEEMSYGVFVEQVFREFAFTRLKREFIGGGERKHRAQSLAPRAVAGEGPVKINIDLVLHCAALAAAMVVLECHHAPSLWFGISKSSSM